jgi:hypothetical protein
VVTDFPVTIKSLSKDAGIKINAIMRVLMMNNIMATANEAISDEVVQLIADNIGFEVEIRRQRDLEAELTEAQTEVDARYASSIRRATRHLRPCVLAVPR